MPLPLGEKVLPTGNGDGHMNEVAPHPARLVLRRMTVRGDTVLVCNQPLGPTQPPTLSGTENEYRPRNSGSVRRLGR